MQDPESKERIHDLVQERYGSIARNSATGARGCGSPTQDQPAAASEAVALGYTEQDLASAGEANLGLGCGNPLALAAIAPGMTVLDLGSGAGFDAFLARERVGAGGRVIGVDMTDDMLSLARRNAQARGVENVEFRKGNIEALPVEDASVDLVISNCVVNLSPDKRGVFREIARVLKPGGQFWISDIVLLQPLPPAVASDMAAYVGCVAGASLLSDYLTLALDSGLADLSIAQIVSGASLLDVLGLEQVVDKARFSDVDVRQAARSVVSAKFHGRKPAAQLKPVGTARASCCAPPIPH